LTLRPEKAFIAPQWSMFPLRASSQIRGKPAFEALPQPPQMTWLIYFEETRKNTLTGDGLKSIG
jgi:hypothetical protein